jgi:hypothetical protein
MKKLLFILALSTTIFSACKKYESPSSGGGTPLPTHHDPVYKIGDYFHNDTLEGIVFLTYGAHNGMIVSLEEAHLSWCIPNYVNSETGATNPYDGWYNTNILMSNYDMRHYPAIQWSHQRNTWHLVYYNYLQISAKQWYVPSSSELSKLLQNQAAVNATLDSLGYPTLEDKTYWSSTELGTRSAAALRMQDDGVVVIETVKDRELYVRAVRNF